MAYKWMKTNYKGIRYRIHPTRKHGKQQDKYYSIRYQANSERIEEGLGWLADGWTLDKAIAELSKLREAAKKGEGPTRLAEKRELEATRKEAVQAEQEQIEKDTVSFGDFFIKTYLPQAKADRPKSVINDEALYTQWLNDTIAPLPFQQISAFHIEKIKKSMTDAGRAPRTVEYCLAVIRQVFNHARRLGIFAGESPTAKVKWPKVDNARMRYLTPEEADLLLSALAEISIDVHDMALLSLHCGLRFGEIAALQWQDVNLDKYSLTIRDAKGGSRTTFLTDKTKSLLNSRPGGAPSDYVFPARKTKRQRPNVSKTFFKVVKEMGFNEGITDRKLKVNFHTLRHSHGTLLYEATHDLYLVQKSLGHKTGTMAQRYAKMSESRLREGAAALEKVFATNGTKQAGQEQAG